MQMTKEKFLAALGAEKLSPRFDRLFAEVMAVFKSQGQHHLSDAFLNSLQEELNIFSCEKLDFVKKSLVTVRENEVLARYSYLLAKAFAARHGEEIISYSELPQASPAVATVDYEMAVFFGLFAFVPELKLYYRWRGVDEETLTAMLRESFEEPLAASEKKLGRAGFDVEAFFERVQYYLNHSVFNKRI